MARASSKTRPRPWWYQGRGAGRCLCAINLGVCYENGKGVEQDWAKAVEWYTAAADRAMLGANTTSACARMARASSKTGQGRGVVHQGRGTGPSRAQPRRVLQEWRGRRARPGQGRGGYTKAANRAMLRRNTTSALLREWPGRRARQAKAVEWYTKAVEQGMLERNTTPALLREWPGVQQDEAKAASGTPSRGTGRCLGAIQPRRCYENGQGVEQDKAKGGRKHQGREQGHANASATSAKAKNGEGVDKTRPRPWSGSPRPRNRPCLAQSILACATRMARASSKTRPRSRSGTPRPRNRIDAQRNTTSRCYENGQGVQQDEAKAVVVHQGRGTGRCQASRLACATRMARAPSKTGQGRGVVHQGRGTGRCYGVFNLGVLR